MHLLTLPQNLAMDMSFAKAPATNRASRDDASSDKQLFNRFLRYPRSDFDLKEVYVTMLLKWVCTDRVDANEQPLEFFSLMLDLYLHRLQAVAVHYYGLFLEGRENVHLPRFEEYWRPLRDAMVNATLTSEAFERYSAHHFKDAIQQSTKSQKVLWRFDNLRKCISEFEQHIRDELQLQVGHLSLLESKASIEQSKIALEESKRVKMRMSSVLDNDETSFS